MNIFSKDSLKNKHIIVTGATGGIGYEISKLLLSMGALISITGRNEDVLEKNKALLAKEVNEKGKIFVKPADLINDNEIEELVNSCENHFGNIYGLVNSAGVLSRGKVEDINKKEIITTMNINFISTFMLTQKVYEKMRPNKGGRIVNISSLSGIRGTFANTAYVASKFAMIGFSQTMAIEAIEHGIKVNSVCPGYVKTKMGEESIKQKAYLKGVSYEEYVNTIKKNIPSNSITNPEEVANTVAYLLTDATKNIIGESIKISGGSVF